MTTPTLRQRVDDPIYDKFGPDREQIREHFARARDRLIRDIIEGRAEVITSARSPMGADETS